MIVVEPAPTVDPVPTTRLVNSITTVLPEPIVVIPELLFVKVVPPFIFNIFAAGVAVPVSSTNEVGTVGGNDPALTPIKNCDISYIL